MTCVRLFVNYVLVLLYVRLLFFALMLCLNCIRTYLRIIIHALPLRKRGVVDIFLVSSQYLLGLL